MDLICEDREQAYTLVTSLDLKIGKSIDTNPLYSFCTRIDECSLGADVSS